MTKKQPQETNRELFSLNEEHITFSKAFSVYHIIDVDGSPILRCLRQHPSVGSGSKAPTHPYCSIKDSAVQYQHDCNPLNENTSPLQIFQYVLHRYQKLQFISYLCRFLGLGFLYKVIIGNHHTCNVENLRCSEF